MSRIMIIGYGNPFRSDDGLGWCAAQRVSEELSGSDIDVRTVQQLTPDLAEAMSRAERVIFIDASAEGEAGTLRCEAVGPQNPGSGTFCHHLTAATLTALAGVLFGKSPEAFIVSVAGESFDFGEGLSPAVLTTFPQLIERVKDLVTGVR